MTDKHAALPGVEHDQELGAVILTASERDRTERPETALYGYLYVATVPGRCKIGVSLTPDRRRRQLENGIGQRIDEFRSYWLYAPGPAERALLARYAKFRLEGEWLADPAGLTSYFLNSYLAARQAKRH